MGTEREREREARELKEIEGSARTESEGEARELNQRGGRELCVCARESEKEEREN